MVHFNNDIMFIVNTLKKGMMFYVKYKYWVEIRDCNKWGGFCRIIINASPLS